MIGDCLWNLDIFDEPLSCVSNEVGGVKFELEAETIDDFDLGGLYCVELSHAMNLFEGDIVAILELVSLVLMHCHDGGI